MKLNKSCNVCEISSCGPSARTISEQLTLQGILPRNVIRRYRDGLNPVIPV